MAAHSVDGSWVREFLAAAMRLAGVAVDDESLAKALPLLEASLADWPCLIRAVPSSLEPMSSPARPVAGS